MGERSVKPVGLVSAGSRSLPALPGKDSPKERPNLRKACRRGTACRRAGRAGAGMRQELVLTWTRGGETQTRRVGDGRQLGPGERVALRPGDTFRAGPVVVNVEAGSSGAEVTFPEGRIGAAAGGGEARLLCAKCGLVNEYRPEGYCSRCRNSLA